VNKATPQITWGSVAPITSGTALSNQQLNATANVAGTFTYKPPAGTVLLAGSNQSLSVTFTPADTTDYTTAAASNTITVNPVASGPTDVSSQVSVTGSGLVYSRNTKLYSGTVTIRNTGSLAIAGPIQAVFTSLISGTALTNQTGLATSGAYGGAAYITAAGPGLAPGASITFTVQYSYSGSAPISYVVKTLSGVF